MLENLFHEEIFPSTQPKPPLAQLEAISSCPTTCYLGEEIDPHKVPTCFQGVVDEDIHKINWTDLSLQRDGNAALPF